LVLQALGAGTEYTTVLPSFNSLLPLLKRVGPSAPFFSEPAKSGVRARGECSPSRRKRVDGRESTGLPSKQVKRFDSTRLVEHI
ncbi:hypothetical protein, partial [Saccharothrix deserti]|uniref:hypothetical protein n=1 Tax=Saccharothrix deserti TaxID=2593674 RepID=UPI001EE47711